MRLPLSQFGLNKIEQLLPILGSAQSRAELRIDQLRLIQKFRPHLHRIATSAGSGQGHITIPSSQMHPIHHRPVPKSTSHNGPGKAVLVDEMGRGTDHRLHH